MSWFLKGKVKGIARNVSNPFKRSINQAPQFPTSVPKTGIEDVQNTINMRNAENKETLRRRAFNYLKQIYTDYVEVGKETYKSTKEHPFKALGYGIFMTSMVIFYKTSPTKTDYEDKRKECLNELIMCGSTYNKRSEFYLNELNKMENSGLLDYKSCVFFSLIMARKFSEYDDTYEKQCTQLHSPSKYNIFNSVNNILKFISRIVDIGFCGNWYFLNKNFVEYDIDEDEWKPKTPSV
ncbi:unnamed protein product [Brachionus calyciflorus]|uniref:Uncharacterized protein n=1 Tax=Brachionus calyciflorus TaxID=104777 RepID=A0A813M3G2_9BILA|nr:unnamed protein product [Brachionus calyciflorus]